MELTERYLKEAERQVEILDKIDPSTQEYKAVVENNTKLTENIVALKKVELEEAKAKRESEVAAETAKTEKKDRWWKNGIAIAGIVLPLGAYALGTVLSWRIDKNEEAIMTSTAGKKGLDSLLRILIK